MPGMEIQGAAELMRKLNALPAKVGKKVVRQSLRQGAKVVQAAAKANALSIIGGDMGSKIAKSIGVRAKTAKWRRKYGAYGIFVGVDPSARIPEFVYFTKGSAFSLETHKQAIGRRHFIPNAIEYGHAFPGKGGGKHPPKDVPARPFMRKAYEMAGSRANQTSMQAMKDGIEAVAQE